MALRKRHLIAQAFSAVLVFAANALSGADLPPTAPQPRQFRVLAAGNPVPLSGLMYELKGKSVPLYCSDVSLSPVYEAPNADPVLFYREAPPVPPETKPRRIPVASLTLGSHSPSLVILKYAQNAVTCRQFDDSWESFPPQTVRVLSLSRRKIATQVEGQNVELAPADSHIFPYSSAKPRIRVKVASLNEDGWKLQFNNSQAVLPGLRVNMVVADFEPTPDDPDPEGINVLKMIDPVRPPSKDQ